MGMAHLNNNNTTTTNNNTNNNNNNNNVCRIDISGTGVTQLV